MAMATIIAFMFFSAVTAKPFSSSASPPPANEPSLSVATDFTSILSSLGFQELARAVPSTIPWSEPSTVFAPTDASVRSCPSCSVSRILSEHTIPGLFPLHYLRKLAFGIKLETHTPGRCVTVTFTTNTANDNATEKVFLGGVEIARPDLFDNGFFLVHGLEGFVSHLSPISCNSGERSAAPLIPIHRHPRVTATETAEQDVPAGEIPLMRLMLRDSMARLRVAGYGILALALKAKFGELVALNNMTVFALDDASILSGGHAYVNNVRFHIVPNWFLTDLDLQRLPAAAVLPTLEPGQTLMVTTPGGGEPPPAEPMRINYVQIKSFDVMHNLKISVHSVLFPFPRLRPPATGKVFGGLGWSSGMNAAMEATSGGDGDRVACAAWETDGGGCEVVVVPPMPLIDHHH